MPKRKPSRAADKLRPIVRKVSVEFTLTDESLKELGDHLRVRGIWASAGMDTLTTADHICFAVFAKARADIPNSTTPHRTPDRPRAGGTCEGDGSEATCERVPCGYVWPNDENERQPHICGLVHGHAGDHKCKVIVGHSGKPCNEWSPNAGAVPRRGSDVGTSPLLGISSEGGRE